MLESQNKIDYTYLGKMCKHFIGRCPELVTLANENGDIIGSAWDLEEDVALFRILLEWQRRGYRYEKD